MSASARRIHRLRLLRDIDVLKGLLLAFAAFLLSGGGIYLWYCLRVWRVARDAPVRPAAGPGGNSYLLLFGKQCTTGEPDVDFRQRIQRALQLAKDFPTLQLVLLGGGGPPTEAEVAERELRRSGLSPTHVLLREDESRDTLENLRNARRLIAHPHGQLLLLSSRYHLARCSRFAQWLRLPHTVCAAEPEWTPSAGRIANVMAEAAYLLWVEMGRQWAIWTRNSVMMAKIS